MQFEINIATEAVVLLVILLAIYCADITIRIYDKYLKNKIAKTKSEKTFNAIVTKKTIERMGGNAELSELNAKFINLLGNSKNDELINTFIELEHKKNQILKEKK